MDVIHRSLTLTDLLQQFLLPCLPCSRRLDTGIIYRCLIILFLLATVIIVRTITGLNDIFASVTNTADFWEVPICLLRVSNRLTLIKANGLIVTILFNLCRRSLMMIIWIHVQINGLKIRSPRCLNLHSLLLCDIQTLHIELITTLTSLRRLHVLSAQVDFLIKDE
jgi:hypothetical protein